MFTVNFNADSTRVITALQSIMCLGRHRHGRVSHERRRGRGRLGGRRNDRRSDTRQFGGGIDVMDREMDHGGVAREQRGMNGIRASSGSNGLRVGEGNERIELVAEQQSNVEAENEESQEIDGEEGGIDGREPVHGERVAREQQRGRDGIRASSGNDGEGEGNERIELVAEQQSNDVVTENEGSQEVYGIHRRRFRMRNVYTRWKVNHPRQKLRRNRGRRD